jgi:hypothetical protein
MIKKFITVMLCAFAVSLLAQTVISPSLVPEFGTFYLMSAGEDGAPLPYDPYPGCAVYSLGDDHYAIDDTTVAAAKAALSEMSPNPVTANDDSSSNGSFSPDYQFSTNGLWIELASIDSYGFAYLILHNKASGNYCQLLSRTNLVQPDWTIGELIRDTDGPKDELFQPVPTNGPTMFFRGVEGFPYVILQEYQNYTIRPASTNDTGRPGELDFSLSDTLATDLNIYFTLGGTASNGVDYVFLTNHVTIPAGNNFASASIQGI